MTLGKFHTLTLDEYLKKRYGIIKQLEQSGNEDSKIYVDNKSLKGS